MTINDAVVVIDDLCGERGTFSIAWKMIRARLYEEVQKPSPNTARDAIARDDCGNCSHKFSCKFSPFGKPLLACEHWECCYSNEQQHP